MASEQENELNKVKEEERVFSLEVLKRAAALAGAANMQPQFDPEYMHLLINVNLNGKEQGVIIRDKTVNRNMPVISIFSPCLSLKREEIKDRLPELSYKLLKANESINFAAYALIESAEDIMVIAACEELLEEITPKAFRASVTAAALAADLFTEKLEKDEA